MSNVCQNAAQITLSQLGGANRISAMTGAKTFYHDENGQTLVINFPKKVHLRVRLEADDTYSVWTVKATGRGVNLNFKESEKLTGVYCENLKSVCEKAVGMAQGIGGPLYFSL